MAFELFEKAINTLESLVCSEVKVEKVFFRCEFCLATKGDLHFMVCNHSICKTCLAQQQGDLQCPKCKTETVLTHKRDRSALPINIFCKPSVEVIQNIFVPKHCATCKLRHVIAKSTYICIECDGDFLCDKCYEEHRTISSTRCHKPLLLKNLQEDDRGRERLRPLLNKEVECPTHGEKNYIEYHCAKCKKLVCKDCLLGAHRGHTVAKIEELAATLRANFEPEKSELQKAETLVNDSIASKREKLVVSKIRKKEAVLSVKQITDSLVEMVKKVGKETTAQVQGLWDMEVSSTEEELERLKHLKVVLQDTAVLANIFSTALSDSDVIESNAFMKSRIVGLTDQLQRALKTFSPDRTESEPVTINTISAAIQPGHSIREAFGLKKKADMTLEVAVERFSMKLTNSITVVEKSSVTIDSLRCTLGIDITDGGDIVVVGETNCVTHNSMQIFKKCRKGREMDVAAGGGKNRRHPKLASNWDDASSFSESTPELVTNEDVSVAQSGSGELLRTLGEMTTHEKVELYRTKSLAPDENNMRSEEDQTNETAVKTHPKRRIRVPLSRAASLPVYVEEEDIIHGDNAKEAHLQSPQMKSAANVSKEVPGDRLQEPPPRRNKWGVVRRAVRAGSGLTSLESSLEKDSDTPSDAGTSELNKSPNSSPPNSTAPAPKKGWPSHNPSSTNRTMWKQLTANLARVQKSGKSAAGDAQSSTGRKSKGSSLYTYTKKGDLVKGIRSTAKTTPTDDTSKKRTDFGRRRSNALDHPTLELPKSQSEDSALETRSSGNASDKTKSLSSKESGGRRLTLAKLSLIGKSASMDSPGERDSPQAARKEAASRRITLGPLTIGAMKGRQHSAESDKSEASISNTKSSKDDNVFQSGEKIDEDDVITISRDPSSGIQSLQVFKLEGATDSSHSLAALDPKSTSHTPVYVVNPDEKWNDQISLIVGAIGEDRVPPLKVYRKVDRMETGDLLQIVETKKLCPPSAHVLSPDGEVRSTVQHNIRIAYDVKSMGDLFYISDQAKNKIVVMKSSGERLHSMRLPKSIRQMKNETVTMARDKKGGVYITASGTSTVYYCRHGDTEIQQEHLTKRTTCDLDTGSGIPCINANGDLVIPNRDTNLVRSFTRQGELRFVYGSCMKKDGPGSLKEPMAVCCDNLGHIYICDNGNNRVTVLSSDGQFITHLLTYWEHNIQGPRAIACSPDGSYLAVTHGQAKVSVFILASHTGGSE